MKTKNNFFLLISMVTVYIIGVLFYSYYLFAQERQKTYDIIDKRLTLAAVGGALFLSDEYHDNLLTPDAIDAATFLDKATQLTRYNDLIGTDYIYTFIQIDGKVRFASTSYKPKERAKIYDEYFAYYEDASTALVDIFNHPKTVFETTKDKWGYFRSILIPKQSTNGTLYVIGADLEVSDVEVYLDGVYWRSIFSALYFFVLLTPFAYLFYRRFKKDTDTLEEVVRERTLQLTQEKKKITDSIEYASLIQKTLIPKEALLKNYFDDAFVIWKPRDIVGGDIYLFEIMNHDDEALLMVIDGTGHGVSGAFVTMLVKAIEQDITNTLHKTQEEISPLVILQTFHTKLQKVLTELEANNKTKIYIGFDGGILYINKRDQTLKYAGANTPLFVIRDDKLEKFTAGRDSIGYANQSEAFKCKEHHIPITPSMQLYISTDGYYDQTGGTKGFAMGKKYFTNILMQHQQENMKKQKEALLEEFDHYLHNVDIKDDITVVGLRL
ncbi:MAG: SpoIIE family protein phosphatase [Campylobacterota bacterium]|nr:SpoIIE family protein phosphatase [Campylobacterota bacterium]